MTPTDREELARLREAERLRRRKAADKRAAARARNREGLKADVSAQPLELAFLRSVLDYAEERLHEATWLEDDMRAVEMSPMTLDVIEVPWIREMVRRYAEALSNEWRFSSQHPEPFAGGLACAECGAPRLTEKLAISDRPIGFPGFQ